LEEPIPFKQVTIHQFLCLTWDSFLFHLRDDTSRDWGPNCSCDVVPALDDPFFNSLLFTFLEDWHHNKRRKKKYQLLLLFFSFLFYLIIHSSLSNLRFRVALDPRSRQQVKMRGQIKGARTAKDNGINGAHTYTHPPPNQKRCLSPLKAFILWLPQTHQTHVCVCVRILRWLIHTHANITAAICYMLQPKRNQNQTNQVAIFIHKIEEPKKMGNQGGCCAVDVAFCCHCLCYQ